MKSLEEVIKYKLNFLPKGTEPFYAIQTYAAERGTNPPPSFYDIYRTKNPIFSNDSYSFMEDITPLFIYISSCEKYYRENGHGEIGCIFSALISEGYEELNFVTSYAHEDYLIEHGYYRPGGYPAGDDYDESEEEDDTEEKLPINDSKTFKSDQCVICLEEEPKVLFCNCGHLCICEKCLVRRFDNCPVCKKENTILRIIE